jgi:hypothetical protein
MATRMLGSALRAGARRPVTKGLGAPLQQRYTSTMNLGIPVTYVVQWPHGFQEPWKYLEYEVMPRDEFGVPAHIPPELSTEIKHTYYVPPQYYPFLKKLGDDTPELKPFMDKLINGEMTYDDYEHMFYHFAKPLKIYRSMIPVPYRTAEEVKHEAEVNWESAWMSFRQRVLGDFLGRNASRDFFFAMTVGAFFGVLYIQRCRQYRKDMKLFYLAAPEHKINWVKPRGDL